MNELEVQCQITWCSALAACFAVLLLIVAGLLYVFGATLIGVVALTVVALGTGIILSHRAQALRQRKQIQALGEQPQLGPDAVQ